MSRILADGFKASLSQEYRLLQCVPACARKREGANRRSCASISRQVAADVTGCHEQAHRATFARPHAKRHRENC